MDLGVTSFQLEIPREIRFGAGALDGLRGIVEPIGTRVLLVSGDRWLGDSPWGSRILAALDGLTVHPVRCAKGEPTSESIANALAAAEETRPQAIVAVGGGSVIDTAKALSGLLAHGGPVERFLEGNVGSVPVPGPGVPWIAIPTTAGTGAEVTKNAVVRSQSQGVKRSMRSAHLLARAVLVDPLLTVSLPPSVTGTAGLDALTQLVEAYVSRGSNPFVRSIVEGAFPGMVTALRGLAASPSDPELRALASYGALMSGIALANAGLGAAHGFAGALGGMFDIPHGLACAVLLSPVLRANRDVIRPYLERLTAPCGREPGSDPVEWMVATVRDLLTAYGLPDDLRAFKVGAEAVEEIVRKSSGSSMRGNPRELSPAERAGILSEVL
ncbi:MAG TPA: iron-containing alcohol dehydrogenase [Spirochaetia bacterium]|nr:iron-containing alcohol dehydrogenase [Spirochaetia bacterium]